MSSNPTDYRSAEGARTTDPGPDTDPDELLGDIEKKRTLRGWTVVAVAVIGILFSAFQMWLAARGFTFEVTLPGSERTASRRYRTSRFGRSTSRSR